MTVAVKAGEPAAPVCSFLPRTDSVGYEYKPDVEYTPSPKQRRQDGRIHDIP